MRPSELLPVIESFRGKHVCVIGDLMLDRYIFGDVERISPEAPIPVVSIEDEFSAPGGAGNVASNIRALGARVSIVGLIGDDEAGRELVQEFQKREIDTEGVSRDGRAHTVQKTRVIARGQHLVRIDKENGGRTIDGYEKKIGDFLSCRGSDFDSIVISDYSKGLLTPGLTHRIIETANGLRLPLVGDTKPAHAGYFKHAYLLTPNAAEARRIAGIADIEKAGRKIQRQLGCNVLVTQGREGMTLFEKERVLHLAARAREVFDVAGAGDTVVAAMALALACRAGLETAAVIANHAAGIVVSKVGTATVTIEELRSDLEGHA